MSPGVHRDAGLALRKRGGLVRVRVHWPEANGGPAAPLLVLLSGEDTHPATVDALCRRLSVDDGLVVMSVRTTALDTATVAVEWGADHASELEADPDAVLVAGIGSGAALAAECAERLRTICDVAPVLRQAMSSSANPGRNQ